MKKNLFAFIAVLGLVGLFSACSSDDKNDPAPPTPGATQFDGFYAGDLNITLEEILLGKFPDYIEIVKQSNDRATLQLKNFTFGNNNLGDIIVPDVVVTHKDGTYTLSGQADIKLEVGECKVDVNATVIDDKLDAKIDVVATTPAGKDEPSTVMNILVKFEGKRTDKVLSREAKLLTFGLKDLETTSVIEDDKVTLTVQKADADKISKAMAVATISDKATISPALDVEQDFTEPVEYTVTAEDGVSKTIYTVTTEVNIPVGSVLSFDLGTAVESDHGLDPKVHPAALAALPIAIPPYIWASSDEGVVLGIAFGMMDRFGVTHIKNDEEFGGPVFSLETQMRIGELSIVPVITSGSLFLGAFNMDWDNNLKSTKFGVSIDKKPIVISGLVGYKSGQEYYRCPDVSKPGTAELVEDFKDAGLISAVVYEVADTDETLDGTNLYTSDKIIGIGKLTFEDGFKDDFEIEIKYTKQFDSTKKYKLALVLSASKDGDKFSGAGGSVLKVSKLEVGFE